MSREQIGGRIVTDGLVLMLDAGNEKSYPGTGTTWSDLSGNGYNHTLVNGASLTTVGGASCINCTGNNYVTVSGTTFTYGNDYTMIAWAYALTDAQVSTWRTLWRTTPDDHAFLIQDNTDIIGHYENNGSDFVSYGLTAAGTGISGNWSMISIVGSGGTSSTLYINDGTTNSTINENITGNSQNTIGNNPFGGGQPYGYVAVAYTYNRVLTADEISQNFNATRHRFGL